MTQLFPVLIASQLARQLQLDQSVYMMLAATLGDVSWSKMVEPCYGEDV